jgi:hypothetical protein
MVHFGHGHHEDVPPVINPPHQHAFILTGNDVLFGTHMTQYHCEIHKYQMVLRLGLPPEARQALRDLRRRNPAATFVLCNAPADPDRGITLLSVPDIASGRRPAFTGNIFFGFRDPPDPAPDGWFPWDLSWTIPMIADVEVTVERVVLFRPFAHHEPPPPHPSYFLFGHGTEAHMTNLQTAGLLTGPFDAPRFGIDYDHVTSLAEAPQWLEPAMLEAGIVVSLPSIPRLDADGHPVILPDAPFAPGEMVETLYRGMGPVRRVKAGPRWLWASVVCNSPEIVGDTPGMSFHITKMPGEYWKDRP